ncbi:DUF2283 domain-containing protein [Aquidulcibacter paucihalophilus]|jgi:uncharacterized protein YuzE|nr:DUF2283 domain-containing protein [Aquidulcibacter paucihalophilus]
MRFEPSRDDPSVGYLYLSNHPGAGTAGCVKSMVRVSALIPNYVGPDIRLDLNEAGEVIGIEVLE